MTGFRPVRGAFAPARAQVVVVGSGIAGLVTALELAAAGADVLVVTKGRVDEGSTRHAQGGIAAAVMPGDSVRSHVSDTLSAGAGLSDADAVAALCADGPAGIGALLQWGVEFDRVGGEFDAGLEGAHSFHRILHAGGDATGRVVETALVAAVREAGVRMLEHAFLVDLLRSSGGHGPVSGVVVKTAGGVHSIAADTVVLASGGAGQLYPVTTNPAVATGDGAAAAWRAGALLADVEMVQFHPTALAVPGAFLVSEAVRGDGAVLRNVAGERFMEAVHPLAELAPRDVVARAIAAEMQRTGAPVVLDATGIGASELGRRFPTITAACRAAGFDWSREPVPVAPAAHYWMGGVATDLDGRTSVPGLYAVGEVACTGVHGANRLASNSLLEGLVFAHRCAAALAAALPSPELRTSGRMKPAIRPEVRDSTVVGVRGELQGVMQRFVGVQRDADGLLQARAALAGWSDAPLDAAVATVEQLETVNLVQLARVMVDAALARAESRGAHYRDDIPATRPDLAAHLVSDRAHPTPSLTPTVAAAVLDRLEPTLTPALTEQVAR